MKFILVVLFCIIADMAHGQQAINKVKINDLNLPQESASSALTIDATKKVKASSTVSTTELEYLDGVTSSVQTQINSKAADSAVVKLTGDQSVSGVKTFTGKAVASSTTNGFTPCPSMTQTQRDATTPSAGDCVYNSTSQKWNIYNGTAWKEAGGGAGGTRLQLMEDSSFEDGVSEGSCSGCVASSESTVVLLTPTNEKSAEIAFSASTGSYTVTKSTSSQFSGAQGYVRCQIKTDQAGVKFRAYVNGTNNDNANDTIAVNSDNTWKAYEIPIVHGTTSAGWSVDATSSITGSVFFDECAIIVGEIGLEVAQAQLAVDAYIAGTASCSWTRTNTAIGALTSTAACPGPTIVRQNVCSWQTTDSDLPRFTGNNCPPGQYIVEMYPRSQVSSGGMGLAIFDGTTISEAVQGNNSTSGVGAPVKATFNYTDTGNRSFELYTGSSSGTVTISNDNASAPRISLRMVVTYIPPASKVYSQPNNDTDWVDCGLTTADFTGFGTVSSIEDLCKKDGADLLMRVKFVSGTPTAVEARVGLRLLGTSLTSANSTIIPTIQNAGTWVRSRIGAVSYYVLIEPSVTYITAGTQEASKAALTKDLGNGLVATADSVAFEARIPIAGWTKSQITGTFANVVTAPGISKPKTCYYKFGGVSATLTAPTECTTGTCVEVEDTCGTGSPPAFGATGNYTSLTFASGTWAASTSIDCRCTAYDVTTDTNTACYPTFTTAQNSWATNSSGGYVTKIVVTTGAGAAADGYVSVSCTGQAP